MGIRFQSPSGSIDESRIASLERNLGATLPADFRNFLLGHNGGKRPTPCMIDYVGVDGFRSRALIAEFLGVESPSESDIFKTYSFYLNDERIPDCAVPIAKDIAGNLFCIRTDPANFGAVCFWDHELELSNEPEGNLALVAGSFSEFVSLLKPDPDEA